jgi:flagellar motor protein MotB
MSEKTLTGSFRGEAGVRDFYTVDADEEEDLLKWETLLMEKISGAFEPFSLQISGLSLNNYYARVIVNKNGRINFQDIYRPAAKEHGAAASTPAPAASLEVTKETSSPGKNIRINTITLSEGTIDFSDHHLNRDFSTTMLNLGGKIDGLSAETGSAANVDLRGNLENRSPLKISGKINPLAKDLLLDMQILFSDIELTPLTPYSGTYLGYAIDKGKLSLTLKYKIEDKKLTAENQVFIDQFTFGEKIESAKATSLPVRLAIALLKDKNGEIHLDLPLSGRTDSPEFSIWGLVGQVLKNLLVKAATSPLALLQASFGGGADFSSISFASGVSRLASSEEDKLRSLTKALAERPGIRLEVSGHADRERDPEGLKEELLVKKMKSEKFLSMAKEKRESGGLSPELIEIPANEFSKWLKAVYEKEKFPRPRTVIGTLKSLPDEEMKKLILANTTVSEQQLRNLARERAVTVMNFLLKEGKLPVDRFFEKSGDPFAPPAKDARAGGRVEFGVIAN